MPAADFAPVNHKLLEWARTEGGWLPEQVAKSLHVKPERVVAWERGERKPTIRQVENLARFLHRPLSIFFLPAPPELPPLASEYRRLPGIKVGAESPQLRLALRQMLNRRDYALNLYEELGEPTPVFDIEAHLSELPASVGARLRARLGVAIEDQLAWTNEWQAWRAWRAAVELGGVLVFQCSKVSLEEARGLSLLDTPLPVVGINSKERIPEAKTFTLLHEVAHLMLANGKEEFPALQERRSGKQWTEVERFAESVASHALLPEDTLRESLKALSVNKGSWSIQEVRRLARRFWITPLAMATRLRESGFMSWKRYNEWRGEWGDHVAALPARAGGFATPAEKAMNRHGRPFVQLVLEAMSGNRLSSVDATRYLDLKFEHFDQLRTLVSGPSAGATSNG
ncbi:MAG: XRE family transcriptional regulator [Burkholderiaceae bacterium]|nr:XRE family transcriptional regulator [Burkholderiaceae bacterium]MDH3461203.1 XRE family transcriptional regulator [Burkholderiaceae bacterium]